MKLIKPTFLKNKDLVIFDLDGTLTPSKSPMDLDMAELFVKLLAVKKVAVISGAQMSQFRIQLLNPLKGHKAKFENLFLFPETSTQFFRYRKGKWREVYAHKLSSLEVKKIRAAFKKAFDEIHYIQPKKLYGPVIQNRGSEVAFSALGQNIVSILGGQGVRLKSKWKKEHSDLKMKIARHVAKQLPHLEVHAAGYTSIDVTRKGIDKAYGVRQIHKQLGVPIKKMVFVGDAIFPGGNDYEAIKSGIDYIKVKGPAETKNLIKDLIK